MKICPSNFKETKLIKLGKIGKAWGSNPKQDKRIKNVMNPENIKSGDHVKLIDPRKGDPRGEMLVETVRGPFNNKVYCEKIGHELYANCFKKVITKQ